MNYTIRSKKLKRTFEFYMNGAGGYVWLEDGSRHGTLGDQICRGGLLQGDTLRASERSFKQTCRAWYRDHLRHTRAGGILEFHYNI